MEFTPLPIGLLQDLLKDRKSSIEDISRANEVEKARIRQLTCPACGGCLQPIPHSKPEVLFRATGLTYQGRCTNCRKVTVEAP